MAKGGFDYSQFKNLYKSVSQIKKEFDAWIHSYLLIEAARALRLVRLRTPVDTGTLRRCWSVVLPSTVRPLSREEAKNYKPPELKITAVERTGNSLTVYLVNPVEYASFMEHGFTKRNGEHYEGFHMAEISMLKVSQNMPARFEREFKKWVNGLGFGDKK